MRMAVPIWEEKISPVMDTASRLLVMDRASESFCCDIPFSGNHIAHRTRLIADLGVEVLLCGAISRHFENMLAAAGIRVIGGLAGPVEAVVKAYREGSLNRSKFLMPGYDRNLNRDNVERSHD